MVCGTINVKIYSFFGTFSFYMSCYDPVLLGTAGSNIEDAEMSKWSFRRFIVEKEITRGTEGTRCYSIQLKNLKHKRLT